MPAPARWAPALAWFGLHVDFGEYRTQRGAWRYLPVATFTCRHGCEHTAVGADDVAHLTRHLDDVHMPTCPTRSAPTTAREPS